MNLLLKAQQAAQTSGYTGHFPIHNDCITAWPTNARCWWGRFGKCDTVGHCLAQELAMKRGRAK